MQNIGLRQIIRIKPPVLVDGKIDIPDNKGDHAQCYSRKQAFPIMVQPDFRMKAHE
jgi:hypothetical protein